MSSDTVTAKEALYLLDTDMEQDMEDYGREVTLQVIKHINRTPELYKFVKGNQAYGLGPRDSATTWAKNHNDEFGDLFISELDSVDWKEVAKRV